LELSNIKNLNFKVLCDNFLSIKFVKDTVWTILSLFFVGITGLLINTLVGNYFNIESVGILNQAISIYLILTIVSNFGIQTATQKYTSQYNGDLQQQKLIYTNAVISTFIVGIFISFIFYFFSSFFPSIFSSKNVNELVNILLLSVPLYSVNKTIMSFLNGIRLMKSYSFARFLRQFLLIVGIISIPILKIKFLNIGYIFLFAEIFTFLYLFFITYRYWSNYNFFWIKNQLIFGSKTILSNFVVNFNTRIPILIIGYTLGDKISGYYSYIEVFAYSIVLVYGAMQTNFNPVFTILWHEQNILEIESKIKKVFKFSLLIFVPLFIILFIFYYNYTRLFMSSDYLQYTNLLIFMLLAVGFRYVFASFLTFLVMSNHLVVNFVRTILYTVTNITLCYLLIIPLQLYGIVVSFFITSLIDLIIQNYTYKKYLNLNLFKILLTK